MKRFFLPKQISKLFLDKKGIWWLFAICLVFVILRLPSLIEPYWYGDEGIYQVVGHAINSGEILYKDIWDNKPPLLYLIYALVDGDLFGVKTISLFFGLGSVISFYFLSVKFFKTNISSILATAVFAILFGAPVIEGNIANAENFMLLPIIISAYLLLSYSQSKNNKNLVIAGFLLSAALILKIVAVFDFVAFAVFIFVLEFENKRKAVRDLLYFAFPFFSLLFVAACYFLVVGAFSDFISAVFLQNVSYVGEQYGSSMPTLTLAVKAVLTIVVIGALIVVRRKNRISIPSFFLYIWCCMGIYSAFFSDRPYIHYLLVMLPTFSLLIGHLWQSKKTRIVDSLLIGFIIFVAYFHFQIYRKNIAYYVNYIRFLANQEQTRDYLSFFDASTPRNYDVATFIKENVKDDEKVFLWSDSPQIYALSKKLPIGKYIVAYHITFYKNADVITKKQIDNAKPKYVIQTVEDPLISELLTSYQLRYIMQGVKIYERQI